MNNNTDILAMRRHEMDAALRILFCQANDVLAKNVNNKVLVFVNHIESELNTTKKELAAFKKNNEELIHRCNAAIASWDEERERALREADRVKHWREKYEDLEKCIRFIGKQIPCTTGGTFENDPVDAILDAAVRSLNDLTDYIAEETHKRSMTLNESVLENESVLNAVVDAAKEEKEHMKLAHDKTLDNLQYAIERAKVFEALAEMLYKSGYDNIDGIKKIYEALREKYPAGTYFPPCKKE